MLTSGLVCRHLLLGHDTWLPQIWMKWSDFYRKFWTERLKVAMTQIPAERGAFWWKSGPMAGISLEAIITTLMTAIKKTGTAGVGAWCSACRLRYGNNTPGAVTASSFITRTRPTSDRCTDLQIPTAHEQGQLLPAVDFHHSGGLWMHQSNKFQFILEVD